MADVFNRKKRSEVMSKIRSKNTKLEIMVFRGLKRKGIYFQRHYRKVVGSPDIAFPRKKIAVFIDGDFWHGYDFIKWKDKLPKKYWLSKIENNIRKDKINRAELRRLGWKVIRIWEHEVKKDLNKTIDKILVSIKAENY